jgi:hypothetical protein
VATRILDAESTNDKFPRHFPYTNNYWEAFPFLRSAAQAGSKPTLSGFLRYAITRTPRQAGPWYQHEPNLSTDKQHKQHKQQEYL